MSQEQKEQRVLAYFQRTMDESGMSASGARIAIVTNEAGEHEYFLFEPIDGKFQHNKVSVSQ